MRYSPEQKARTHAQIVETAAREFRDKGLHGIGIADLMSRLGLTHGGFYAHFRDRDALVAEASSAAAAESFRRLIEAAEEAPAGGEVHAMIDFYLSRAHRDDPGHGCLLPALAADISRQHDSVRSAFTGSLKENLEKLSRYMPAKDDRAGFAQALTMISAMAGGLLIARAIDDPESSGFLLDSLRKQLRELYRSWCV